MPIHVHESISPIHSFTLHDLMIIYSDVIEYYVHQNNIPSSNNYKPTHRRVVHSRDSFLAALGPDLPALFIISPRLQEATREIQEW